MKKVTIVIQMVVTGLISYLIAKALKLDYAVTAGILAVLSTQLTKRESFQVAIKRGLGTVLGLFLASLMFVLFGYNIWIFWIFVLIFAGLSFSFSIEVGLVPVLVLVSHLLDFGSFSWKVLVNEFAIMAIAIIVVLVYDLVSPSHSENKFKEYIDEIDKQLKDHMQVVVNFLKKEATKEETLSHYEQSIVLFEETYQEAIVLDKDLLFVRKNQYLAYLEMRKTQIAHINHIYQHALKLVIDHEHTLEIVKFIEALIKDVGYYDKATSQLEKLNEVRIYYRNTKLPKTRKEFETRAMLYQMLNELEYFLDAKIMFHSHNPNFGF